MTRRAATRIAARSGVLHHAQRDQDLVLDLLRGLRLRAE
jgi:hypothetical protein